MNGLSTIATSKHSDSVRSDGLQPSNPGYHGSELELVLEQPERVNDFETAGV